MTLDPMKDRTFGEVQQKREIKDARANNNDSPISDGTQGAAPPKNHKHHEDLSKKHHLTKFAKSVER